MKVYELLEDRTDEGYLTLVSILKKHCKKAINLLDIDQIHPIYRGAYSIGEETEVGGKTESIIYTEVLGRHEARTSKTDSSLFLSFVSESPIWNGVPKRIYSTFGTPSVEMAADFGATWLIIPYDNNKIAEMDTDFNDYEPNDFSMHKIGQMLVSLTYKIKQLRPHNAGDLEELPMDLQDILMEDSLTPNVYHLLSMEEIKAYSASLKRLFIELQKPSSAIDILDGIDEVCGNLIDAMNTDDLYQFLNTNINPEKMGVTVHHSYSETKQMPEKAEVWFEGNYIAIKYVGRKSMKDFIYENWFKELVKDVFE
jgi:hypothetical protein